MSCLRRRFVVSCLLAGSALLAAPWGDAFVAAQRTADATAVKLAVGSPFSDHMVLQRDSPAPVWGWSTPGATIGVSLGEKRLEAIADESGRWQVDLGPLSASDKPQSLSIRCGEETLSVADVLVGEVWLASGQSNMEWPLKLAKDPEQEAAAADWPAIRLLKIPHVTAETLQETVANAGWNVCTPASAPEFSAIGYFFARELHQELNVPVGILSVNWGGTMMEAWTSREALAATGTFAPIVKSLAPADDLTPEQRGTPNRPGVLINGMLAPMIPYGIRGAIWYQGESNAGRASQYRELSELMIADWRVRWDQGDFPFLFVQLAGWEPGGASWPYLREAQTQTLEVPETGMAVAIDIGDQQDIHPKNKQEVGRRLALIALANTYDRDVEFSGPLYRDIEIDGGAVTVSFDHAAGLKHEGDALRGFQLAGADGNFKPATAKIAGDAVVLSAEGVREPVAVRYNWAAYPNGNLQNEAGLPAVPFRTDGW
ncbi:MAG: sialate O-acetylesterase [Pirellulales bacterium]|nr:sialate O-acetylesterase [Pirellulales bacterium]